MAVISYVVVGPKKTGSTSFYDAVRRSYDGPLDVLPKEANQLLTDSFENLAKRYRAGVIEVCPEYFSSYRALIRLNALVQDYKIKVRIIVLEREEKQRVASHISYMFNEGVIGKELREAEVETIALQAQNEHFQQLWERLFETIYLDMRDEEELKGFWQEAFGTSFVAGSPSNVGGRQASWMNKAILKPLAGILRGIGARRIVERVSEAGALDWIAKKHLDPKRQGEISSAVQRVYAVLGRDNDRA